MSRVRIVFLLGFILSLAAGVVVGMVVSRPGVMIAGPATKPSSDRDPGGRNSFAEKLELTPQQDEAMKKIWNEVQASMRQFEAGRFDRRHALADERDKAVLLLIPPEKKADYERIQQEHAAKMTELNNERDRIFKEADEKTKAILSEAQWKKLEEMKKDHRGPRGPGGPGGPGGGRHGGPPPPPPDGDGPRKFNPTTDPHDRVR
jgi:hypothetical protein